jgi:hypothetical protein
MRQARAGRVSHWGEGERIMKLGAARGSTVRPFFSVPLRATSTAICWQWMEGCFRGDGNGRRISENIDGLSRPLTQHEIIFLHGFRCLDTKDLFQR